MGHGERVHEDLWSSLAPSLRAMLPAHYRTPAFDGSKRPTLDISMNDAYAESFRRFENLDELKRVATRLYETSSGDARLKFAAMLRRSVGVEFNSSATTEQDKRAITEAIDFSVERIKTINTEHFENFKTTINQGILEGVPFMSLRDRVIGATASMHYPGWMVDRVVVDQFLTAHASIQENRQRSAGITHYFWRTATDARVRPTHEANEGLRFAWDSPPPETRHPGTEIRCRCIADPDIQSLPRPQPAAHF